MLKIEDFKMINSKFNKDIYGEVFTDIILISKMLKNIEKEKWSDPSQNFFDPSCGIGYFLYFIYDILMGNGHKYEGYKDIIGLKNHFHDEKVREKHIIENMLYGCDIQKESIDSCVKFFKGDKYKTNFICIDYLKFDNNYFNVKLKNIVGNPPFQSINTDKTRKAKNHNLWSPIIIKSFEILEDDGFMSFICPQSWMSWSKSNSNMFNILKNNNVLELNINECRKYFKGVGSSFSYFALQKSTSKNSTHVICEYKKNIYESDTYFKDLNCLPLLINNESLNILRKTIFTQSKKFNLTFDSYLHAYTKKDLLSKNKDDNYKYKVWHTPNSILWSKKKHISQDSWKLFIPISTYYEEMIVDKCGNSQGMGYIICDDEMIANKYKYILSLKLYRFIVNITRWSNWNSPDILKNLPLVDVYKDWCDDSLYAEFKLSIEEIELIENIIT
jgi:adenine-specific DNA-methyltransferase